MIRLAIVVEGPTEWEFITNVLAVHLRPQLVMTPRPLDGNVSIGRLAMYMADCFHSFDAVTSMVDFYGFRDKGDAQVEELEQHIDEEIGKRINKSWNESLVFSYVQKHEFESLLFSDVQVFADYFPEIPEAVEKFLAIRKQFDTPEDINDGRETAPSKRIEQCLLPDKFQKSVAGPILAEDIGLSTMRKECRRFNRWVARLEALTSA